MLVGERLVVVHDAQRPTLMLFTILSYVVAAVHVLFPPYLLYRLWRMRLRTVGAWLIEAGFTVSVLAVLYLFGRWDVVGVPLRYRIGATCFLEARSSKGRSSSGF